MQADSVTFIGGAYDDGMQTGRPPKHDRPPLGARIAALREEAGLSQQHLADLLDVNQQMIAYWERRASTLRPAQLAALADALKVSVDELLGKSAARTRGGPSGRVRHAFEKVSRLPRRKQQKIVEVVEALVAQHGG
ncbi:MAG TPA: helix-turn-helix transcriptional regulator [Kiritimatiellia bacterium]|nr:helix-turn-helix transcriptional regulator [Kiritimatiellia bacterium]